MMGEYKQTHKKKEGQEAKSRRRRGWIWPWEEHVSSCPSSGRSQSGFAVLGIRHILLEEFRKLILFHAVCVMMWSSMLCLIASKRHRLKYRLPARGIPSPPEAPLQGRRGTSSHGRCLNGARFIIAPRPPVCVSVPFFWLFMKERCLGREESEPPAPA